MIRIINLTSLKITNAFHLLLNFTENQIVFWDFKIQNSIRITVGSDNGDLDNLDSTVLIRHNSTQLLYRKHIRQ